MVSSLVEGKIVYLEAEGEKEMEIESGVVEVRDNEVIICIG